MYPKVSNVIEYDSMNISLEESSLKYRGKPKLKRNFRSNVDDDRRI
jgi:hypothetical protein